MAVMEEKKRGGGGVGVQELQLNLMEFLCGSTFRGDWGRSSQNI